MVVPVLTKLGVSLPALRAEAAAPSRSCPAWARARATEEGQPSAELVAVLRAAEAQARELSDEYVSTEHLLLALAQDSGPRRARRCAPWARAPSASSRRSPRCAAPTA